MERRGRSEKSLAIKEDLQAQTICNPFPGSETRPLSLPVAATTTRTPVDHYPWRGRIHCVNMLGIRFP